MRHVFGALPLRMARDATLSSLDCRVATAIAAHDRFGANGRGCVAGRDRLAKMVGCDPTSMSKSITKLVERGYISEEQNPDDLRKKVLRMVYSDEDAALFGPSALKRPTKAKAATRSRRKMTGETVVID